MIVEFVPNEKVKDQINEAISAALTKACLIVERDAKKKAPIGDGQLNQSITHEVVVNDKEKCGYVGSNVEYAPYVEIGTGIYSSQGDGRQTPWRYQDEKTGKWYYTRGMQPQPFLKPAADENRNKILKQFEGII